MSASLETWEMNVIAWSMGTFYCRSFDRGQDDFQADFNERIFQTPSSSPIPFSIPYPPASAISFPAHPGEGDGNSTDNKWAWTIEFPVNQDENQAQ